MARELGVTFAIGAKVGPSVVSAFATVEQKIRASQARVLELNQKAKALAEADAARKRVMETQRAYAASGGRDPMLGEALRQELAAFNKAAAAAKKYGVEIRDIARAHAETDRALANTRGRLEALQQAQSFKARRQEAAESMRATVVPALAVAAPVREAIKFESAMASAAKTIDGMRDENGKLTAQYYEMEAAIKQMGQTLPLTHDELARLFAAGGQQGMTAVSDLREFTTMAAQMAVAFDMTTEQAAQSIGTYRTALNLTMPEARSLLDLMNQFANTTSANEKDIADVVRRVGSLGEVGGVSAKAITALAATLTAMGVAPEVAATGTKNLILALVSGTAATKSQKAAFASLGIDTVKLAKQMQKDGPAAILSVLNAIKKLPKDKQLSIMQQIFGKDSLTTIAALQKEMDLAINNLKTAADESKYGDAMQKEFSNVSGTTANKLILLKNRVQEVGITIANALLPAIQSITETIGPPISAVAKFASEHQTLTKVVIGAAAGLIALKLGVTAVTWIVAGTAGAFNLAKAGIAGFSAATKVAAVGQTVFNAAMAANPVGLVVTAVAALGAGLVYLYKTCEPVRVAFDKVFTIIGDKLAWVSKGFQTVKAGLKSVASFLGFGDDEEEGSGNAVPKPQPQEYTQLYDSWGMPIAPQAKAPETAAPTPKTVAQPAQSAAAPTVAQPAQAQAQMPQKAATQPPVAQAASQAPSAQTSPQMPPPPQAAPDTEALLKQMAAQGARNKHAAPQQPQIIQPQVQVNVNVAQNGIPEASFAQGVINAINARKNELEKMITEIVNNQARLAYGG